MPLVGHVIENFLRMANKRTQIGNIPVDPIGFVMVLESRQLIVRLSALGIEPSPDATSALDYESERIVHDNMAEIARGRTVFIIAHRLSAVRHADRIITIDHGRIVEDGKHEDLMRTGGRYSQLYRLQGGIQVVSDAGRDR